MLKRVDVWIRIALFLSWSVGTALLTWQLIVFPKRPGPGPDKDVPFFIEPTDNLESIGTRLRKEKAVRDREAFVRYMRLSGGERLLSRGWVPINRALEPKLLLYRLFDVGVRPIITMNIPEGFTRFDVATRVERFGFASRDAVLALTEDPNALAKWGIEGSSAEGRLFPATYQFPMRSDATVIVERMVVAFKNRSASLFKELADARARGETTLTDREALILASIVEREAHVADERPIIARVFQNRLNDPTFKPHRLQADPTVAYGCLVAGPSVPSCATFDGRRVTPAMVRDKLNPYNTYRIEGLPPGPIANPGLLSLEAVVHPAEHDYFYFVATGGGRHSFSRTLEEHNARIRGEL